MTWRIKALHLNRKSLTKIKWFLSKTLSLRLIFKALIKFNFFCFYEQTKAYIHVSSNLKKKNFLYSPLFPVVHFHLLALEAWFFFCLQSWSTAQDEPCFFILCLFFPALETGWMALAPIYKTKLRVYPNQCGQTWNILCSGCLISKRIYCTVLGLEKVGEKVNQGAGATSYKDCVLAHCWCALLQMCPKKISHCTASYLIMNLLKVGKSPSCDIWSSVLQVVVVARQLRCLWRGSLTDLWRNVCLRPSSYSPVACSWTCVMKMQTKFHSVTSVQGKSCVMLQIESNQNILLGLQIPAA